MIIVDIGFWVALINQRDTYHELVKSKLAELGEQNELLVTTNQRDFGVYRWKQTYPFVNLMFP